jgi:hypothetical protein
MSSGGVSISFLSHLSSSIELQFGHSLCAAILINVLGQEKGVVWMSMGIKALSSTVSVPIAPPRKGFLGFASSSSSVLSCVDVSLRHSNLTLTRAMWGVSKNEASKGPLSLSSTLRRPKAEKHQSICSLLLWPRGDHGGLLGHRREHRRLLGHRGLWLCFKFQF